MIGDNFVVLLVLVTGVLLAGYAVKQWSLRKATDAARLSSASDRARLYYFWTPSCTSCHRLQRPVIERLAGTERENVEIVSVNAHEAPERARAFGIWTVPTTVVVTPNGRVRHVNHGPVDLLTLQRQVATAGRNDEERDVSAGGPSALPVKQGIQEQFARAALGM